MNSYTIVKMLALCLGAVSVVTRTLPEQRSEIHARAAGGYGFSNNPTNQDSAGAMIDLSEFSAASDVNDLKRRDGTGTAQNPGFWDFRDNGCEFFCSAPETPERNPDDCRELGELLTKRSVLFGVKPNRSFSINHGNCSITWTSQTPSFVITSYAALGADVEPLLSSCSNGLTTRGCNRIDQLEGRGSVSLGLAHPNSTLVPQSDSVERI